MRHAVRSSSARRSGGRSTALRDLKISAILGRAQSHDKPASVLSLGWWSMRCIGASRVADQRARTPLKAESALAAAALLVGALGAIFAAFPAHAEESCLTAPSGTTPQGSHWYYRTDPATHVKCWHLKQSGEAGQSSPVAQEPNAGPVANQPVQARTEAADRAVAQDRPLQPTQAAPNIERRQTAAEARRPTGAPAAVTDAVPWLDAPLPGEIMARPRMQPQTPAQHPRNIAQPVAPSPAAPRAAVTPTTAAGAESTTTASPAAGPGAMPAMASQATPTETPSATTAAPIVAPQSGGEMAAPQTPESAATAGPAAGSTGGAGKPMELESAARGGGVMPPQGGEATPLSGMKPSQSQSVAASSDAPGRVVVEDRLYQIVARNRIMGGLVLANLIGLLIAGAFVSRILRRITRLVSAPGL
jgi:hypothetical protein